MKSSFDRITSQRGFTMVELIIVIVLVGVIAMTASLLIGQASQSYQKGDAYSTMTNQGRLALEQMAREIRMIRSPSDISSPCTSTTSLNFIDTNGNPVSYSFAGSTLSSGGNILADNLTAFSITYYDKSSPPVATTTCSSVWTVMVSLTFAQGNDSLPMRMTIHPRSF